MRKLVIIHMIVWIAAQSASCQTMEKETHNYNRLKDAASPYLQQHAKNPVDWYPWGEEALNRAKEENKPIIVSIGYSSCHWCHVMERESFENDSIATIMNNNFINIKVDREERPDIDQIYMEAVQAMGINGGWPLNVFLTPDQKPFYGGTYFPPKNWATLLSNITTAFAERREEIEASAAQLTDAVGMSELLKYKLKPTSGEYTMGQQDSIFEVLAPRFDSQLGGFDRAPKFPMPSIWSWMLEYGYVQNNEDAIMQVYGTLDAMGMGGIYDQIGGGFARYSTDKEWLVPHFEKMLYDNGQLLKLYSKAYKGSGKAMYKEIVYGISEWLEREMTAPGGGFYAAMDADSEGVEGKYYVWDFREFQTTLAEDAPLMAAYLDVGVEGNWEGHSILRKTRSDDDFVQQKNISEEDLASLKTRGFGKLMEVRNQRIAPGLDNKTLAGWNGMAITGLLEAYGAFGDDRFLNQALTAANYVNRELMMDSTLLRAHPGNAEPIYGYLEDYAFIIEAYIALYEHTFDEEWISKAEGLTDYTLKNFLDASEDMFYYTDKKSHSLVVRKKEIFDNVIPSSNSQMAHNLQKLGTILDRPLYTELSATMISRIRPMLAEVGSDLSNWSRLHLNMIRPTAEIVIVGPEANEYRNSLSAMNIPNSILMGSIKESNLPLLKGKSTMNGRTTIYVCFNKTCKLPVTSVEEALKQLP